MNLSPQMNMLTAQEFRRLIAKMGGLWSASELSELLEIKVRNWTGIDGFPDPAWQVGRVKVYSGWEVWEWLLRRERWSDASVLEGELEALARRSFGEEA